jgi:ABC-2 type transport system permease protein
MNLQRVSALAIKNLKAVTREPATLFLIVLFPVMLTLVYGVAFGALGGEQTTIYQIGIYNGDSSSLYPRWTQYFIGNLSAMEILDIHEYAESDLLESDLSQGNIQAAIVIPENYGESCQSFWEAPNSPSGWVNTTLQLYLDSGSLFATQAIPPIIQQTLARAVYGIEPSSSFGPIQIGSPSLVEASRLTMFDYMLPGLFAFYAIFLIMTVSQSFTFEREKGLIRRINITPATPADIMISQTASGIIIAMAQVAIVFAAAFLMGGHVAGGVPSYALAFIILAVFSLCNVGFGLISATIVKSSGAATGVSFIFIVPQMILGTYVPLGSSPMFQILKQSVPSYYVTDALTSLFLRGAFPLSSTILLDVLAVSVYSFAVLVLGIFLFGKYGKT